MTNLSCDDIRDELQTGATLLDVRNANEFQRGALPSAQNIPLSLLPILANERLSKDQSVLVYCHAGARAAMAEKVLTELGFTNVINIGGIQHYPHCH